ncbi:MAG: hypothetical protein EA380_00010, partial [Phycisphaeraceae bacterium]
IAYFQNDDGPVYITEILTIKEMFNCSRFTYNRHPYTLYRNAATVNKLFKADSPEFDPDTAERLPGPITPMDLITPRLPDILRLADDIRAAVPAAAKEIPFNLGNMKLRPKAKERSGSKKHKGTPLHFNGQTVDHKVSNGWVLPMLAAFRANVDWDLGPYAHRPDLPPDQQPKWDGKSGHFNWRVPLDDLLPKVIKEMVSVCVSAHNAKIPAEEVAAKESSFVQCYDKVLIALARMGKDISNLSS